jgi:hypothetical protein
MAKTRHRRRAQRGGEGMFSGITDTFKNVSKRVYGFLGFQDNTPPPREQMIEQMNPYSPLPVEAMAPAAPAAPAPAQDYASNYSMAPAPPPPPRVIGGKKRRRHNVKMMASSKVMSRFRLFRGGSNVTPYSSNIWSANQKTVGGRKNRRKKYRTLYRR